jgi:hypothetical protein
MSMCRCLGRIPICSAPDVVSPAPPPPPPLWRHSRWARGTGRSDRAPFPGRIIPIGSSLSLEGGSGAKPREAGRTCDSTLRVACLANPGTQPDCPAAGDGAWRNATSSPQAIPGLTAGDLYSCYAAEFVGTDYRVCSTAVIDAVAALNAPTVAASTGTVARRPWTAQGAYVTA